MCGEDDDDAPVQDAMYAVLECPAVRTALAGMDLPEEVLLAAS